MLAEEECSDSPELLFWVPESVWSTVCVMLCQAFDSWWWLEEDVFQPLQAFVYPLGLSLYASFLPLVHGSRMCPGCSACDRLQGKVCVTGELWEFRVLEPG